MNRISKLHFITQYLNEHDHAYLANEACKGGADWVQLRIKNVSPDEWNNEALKVQGICKKYNAKFIVNDNVDLAKEIKADGVHLGKEDMDPLTARIILGEDFIIGGTANSLEDILELNDAKVDYIGLGPYRFTTTKENLSPVIGLEGYKNLISECKARNIKVPIIAIGGIKPDDIVELMKTGIYGIAISSFINKSKDKAGAARKIIATLNTARIKD